jgi:hypothetical protein
LVLTEELIHNGLQTYSFFRWSEGLRKAFVPGMVSLPTGAVSMPTGAWVSSGKCLHSTSESISDLLSYWQNTNELIWVWISVFHMVMDGCDRPQGKPEDLSVLSADAPTPAILPLGCWISTR